MSIIQTPIEVTAVDILEGYRGHTDACALRNAVKRRLKPGVRCLIMPDIAIYNYPGKRPHKIKMGRRIRDFIRAFDRGDSCEPVTLMVPVPEEFLR